MLRTSAKRTVSRKPTNTQGGRYSPLTIIRAHDERTDQTRKRGASPCTWYVYSCRKTVPGNVTIQSQESTEQ